MSGPVAVSIVIPTHNRATIVGRCLGALFRQTNVPDRCEIIVVDDGSVDQTRVIVEHAVESAPVPLAYLRQEAAGPAAARNRGVRAARGEVVLFLGDDIIAEPSLVAEHWASHQSEPDPLVGVLGFVTWSSAVVVTPYMRWLEASGNQFAYGEIRGRDTADPTRYLYTANLSLKRHLFVDTGEWFDERFKHALLEDIDLGRRLAARGLTLKYNPAAMAAHEHAVTLAGYARRIERSSEYWLLLEQKSRGADATGPVRPVAPGARVRRNHTAYAWFVARVCADIVRNWPFWWLALYFEHRTVAPTIFRRAHRHWAQRGLLRLEVRKAMALLSRAS